MREPYRRLRAARIQSPPHRGMSMVMTAAGINMAAPQCRIMTTQAKSTAQIYSVRFSSLLDPRWKPSVEPPLPSLT